MFVTAVTRTGPPPPPRAPGATGFRLPDASASGSAVGVGALSSTLLLAAQEAGQDAVQDREARRHGQAVLADLKALQLDLLRGTMGTAGLARSLAHEGPEAADPALRAALRSVRVRAAVEAARLRLYSTT